MSNPESFYEIAMGAISSSHSNSLLDAIREGARLMTEQNESPDGEIESIQLAAQALAHQIQDLTVQQVPSDIIAQRINRSKRPHILKPEP